MRECPIVSSDETIVHTVISRMENTPVGQLVWNKIPSRADIHSYSADYCKNIYNLYARPVSETPMKDRYTVEVI